MESILVVCTRSRKNQETLEGILEWLQRLELAYVELMGSRKDPELHAKVFCEGLVQMQPETNGMPGEWVKEITGTCILKLGKGKHIPLISLWKYKDQFKKFSDRLSIFHKNWQLFINFVDVAGI